MKDDTGVSNLNVLIAVDDSEASLRAVAYAGAMLHSLKAIKLHVLHIINEPEEDFFPDLREQKRWIQEQQEKMGARLEAYRKVLLSRDVPADSVLLHLKVRYCPSVAQCILKETEALDCKTVVIGRKGISREEEFLFGSVSNRIIHKAQDCTVWVVA